MAAGRGRLAEGREAFERRAWDTARMALEDARRAGPVDPEDLWRLALCSYLTGRDDDYVASLEAAHRAFLSAERPLEAIRCAFWIGHHLMNTGEVAQATGWFSRAGRLPGADDAESAARGYLMMPAAHKQFVTGRLDEAARSAGEVVDIAQRYRDPDLLTLALHLHGRALLRLGNVEEGLTLLDEAMVSVTTDALSPILTGLVYCSVIGACREVYALDRAREWTTALEEWCARQRDLVAYSGECRGYRSEILLRAGEWRAGIGEARRAAKAMGEKGGSRSAGFAHYQAGEAHRLLGQLEEAEAAYRDASRCGYEPQPGLSLLRLVQGEPSTARASIRRALTETGSALARVELLPAYVEIMLATGEVDDAERACMELEETARRCTRSLDPRVAQCRGAVALGAGDPQEALRSLREAWRGWQRQGVPYEAARTRVLLARACRAMGDDDGAVLELTAARAELARLGAAADLRALDALVDAPPPEDHGLTPRETEVLELVATGMTNRAIGESLFISEKTVARHVANIFRKVGVSSRAEATAYAYEHGLVRPST